MQFQNFTKDEILKDDTLGPGVYAYKVSEAIEKKSQAGNEMIKLILDIETQQGGTIQIHDYLVSTVRWKLKQFAKSCGMLDQLEAGIIKDHQLINKRGTCELHLEKGDKGEFLRVKKYFPQDENHIEDDELPF